MVTVFDVAKYILEQLGTLSTMKLQKLCYYAQAWSLVWNEEPLFPNEFEAWVNGPVCRELFVATKGEVCVGASYIEGDSSVLSEDQKKTVNSVLKYYGDKEANWLSQLTHMEEPWIKAREGFPSGVKCHNIVTKESMAKYYGNL
ncbi:MAG: DUF4065 domain-containing protein [bacterium]|nr:DUF4065 domain-containing protein [bacterium]